MKNKFDSNLEMGRPEKQPLSAWGTVLDFLKFIEIPVNLSNTDFDLDDSIEQQVKKIVEFLKKIQEYYEHNEKKVNDLKIPVLLEKLDRICQITDKFNAESRHNHDLRLAFDILFVLCYWYPLKHNSLELSSRIKTEVSLYLEKINEQRKPGGFDPIISGEELFGLWSDETMSIDYSKITPKILDKLSGLELVVDKFSINSESSYIPKVNEIPKNCPKYQGLPKDLQADKAAIYFQTKYSLQQLDPTIIKVYLHETAKVKNETGYTSLNNFLKILKENNINPNEIYYANRHTQELTIEQKLFVDGLVSFFHKPGQFRSFIDDLIKALTDGKDENNNESSNNAKELIDDVSGSFQRIVVLDIIPNLFDKIHSNERLELEETFLKQIVDLILAFKDSFRNYYPQEFNRQIGNSEIASIIYALSAKFISNDFVENLYSKIREDYSAKKYLEIFLGEWNGDLTSFWKSANGAMHYMSLWMSFQSGIEFKISNGDSKARWVQEDDDISDKYDKLWERALENEDFNLLLKTIKLFLDKSILSNEDGGPAGYDVEKFIGGLVMLKNKLEISNSVNSLSDKINTQNLYSNLPNLRSILTKLKNKAPFDIKMQISTEELQGLELELSGLTLMPKL